MTVLKVSLLTESAVLLRYESIILYEEKKGEGVSFSTSIHNDFIAINDGIFKRRVQTSNFL